MKIIAVQKREFVVIDIGGAYLNAYLNEEVFMWLSPDLVKILVKIVPIAIEFVDQSGRILVRIDKAYMV